MLTHFGGSLFRVSAKLACPHGTNEMKYCLNCNKEIIKVEKMNYSVKNIYILTHKKQHVRIETAVIKSC